MLFVLRTIKIHKFPLWAERNIFKCQTSCNIKIPPVKNGWKSLNGVWVSEDDGSRFNSEMGYFRLIPEKRIRLKSLANNTGIRNKSGHVKLLAAIFMAGFKYCCSMRKIIFFFTQPATYGKHVANSEGANRTTVD